MLLAATLALVLGAAPAQTVAPTLPFEGWNYAISPRGELSGRTPAQDAAARHAAGEAARQNAPVWHVKVLFFTRADIVYVGRPAALMRGAMSTAEVERVQAEVARFAQLAEVEAGGRLRVQLHLEVDAERVVERLGEVAPYGPEFLERALGPVVNAVVFDPGETAYRGPFDSAFVLHGGLTPNVFRAEVNGAHASSLPTRLYPAEGALAGAMLNEWSSHLATRMRDLGFDVPDGPKGVGGDPPEAWPPDAFMAPALWEKAGTRFAPTAAYIDNATSNLAQGANWSELRANPYRLPRLDQALLSAKAGRRVTVFAPDSTRARFAVDGVGFGSEAAFRSGSNALAQIRVGGKQWLIVDWAMADLFGSHFAPRLQAKAVGRLAPRGRQFVVFEAVADAAAQPEVNLLAWDGVSVEARPAPRGQPIELVVPEGAKIALPGGGAPGVFEPEAEGARLVRVEAGGASRWAAVAAADPVEVVCPRFLQLGGPNVRVPVELLGPDPSLVETTWETPPGWTAPAPNRGEPGVREIMLRAPEGSLDQEIRLVLTEPATGAVRKIPIKVARQGDPIALDMAYGPGSVPSTWGTMTAKPDPAGGVRFEEPPGTRSGGVDLLKRAGGRPVFNADLHPLLELTVAAGEAEPLELFIESATDIQTVRLFDVPGAVGPFGPVLRVDGPWSAERTLTIDLGALKITGEVVRVSLETPGEAPRFERVRPVSSLLVRRVRVLRSAEARPTPLVERADPLPDATSSDPWARAVAALENPTPALVADPKDLVALNAALGLRRKKAPECVPALALLLRSLEPAVVEVAAQALAFQDTPDAWAALENALDVGPSDEARAGAAGPLARKRGAAVAATLTSMIVAKNPSAREAGVAALASIPGAEPAQMMMVFLQDVSPAVRLAVVRGANIENETVARRVQYESVNDPSDAVRAASYLALTRSTLEGFADEGYRGVRDDSPAVRLALLAAFEASPFDSHRRAPLLAVADTDPRVRGAALRVLARLRGDVTLEELGGVVLERDPRVQRPLIELADAKNLTLPEASLSVLRESVDPTVAQWAKAKGTPHRP